MAAWRSKCHHAFLWWLVCLYLLITRGHRWTSKKGGEGSCSAHRGTWSPRPLGAASKLSLGVSPQADHTTDLDFRVMVQVLMADFLPGTPTDGAARTVTYSGCSRAALLPSRQY